MWLASTSVMVAVVQCTSRVGGSPRLPTLRTPPFFWAVASETEPVRQSATTAREMAAHVVLPWRMWHLRRSEDLTSEDLVEEALRALLAVAPEERLGVAG